MQNLKLAFGALVLGFLLLMSCNKSSLIGSDLLEEDEFDLRSSDDIEILARSVYAQPVKTFDTISNFQLTDYLIGQIDDPVFGTYASSLFVEFDLSLSGKPDFEGQILDSAIIILAFDGSNAYGGALNQPIEVEISKIANRFEPGTNYFSNDEIATGEILGTVTMFPSPDSVRIEIPNSTSLRVLPPHFRIPLPAALAQEIFSNTDSINFNSSNDFQNFFPGLAFKPVGTNQGIFGVELRAPVNPSPRIEFFYHQDTLFESYSFPVGTFATKLTTFTHDHSNTIVDEFVQKGQAGGDSLLFIQSMEGVDIEIEFPDLSAYQGIVVNKAELIFEIDSLPGYDLSLYPPTERLIINEIETDGDNDDFTIIEDLITLITRYSASGAFTIFGGAPDDDGVYSMNITAHFQRIVDGEVSNKLLITPLNGNDQPPFSGLTQGLNRGNKAFRSVIKGPGHPNGRMKLVLNYTKL